jgi:1,2-phenylacetyl-CoA epoxidase PaaB subunit
MDTDEEGTTYPEENPAVRDQNSPLHKKRFTRGATSNEQTLLTRSSPFTRKTVALSTVGKTMRR